MHVFKPNNATRNKKLRLGFSKLFALVVMVSKVATCDEICDQVKVFIVLEGIKHIDQERMLELTE